jgi:hypothetical protein
MSKQKKYTFIQSVDPSQLTDTDSRSDIWLVNNSQINYDCIMKISFLSVTLVTSDGKEVKYEPASGILLEHEIEIYKYILTNLIQKNNVRNVLRIIDSLKVDAKQMQSFLQTTGLDKNQLTQNVVSNFNFMLGFTSERTRIDKKSIRTENVVTKGPFITNRNNDQAQADYTKPLQLQVLVTPKIQGTFDQLVFAKKFSSWEFMRYMFILFTTLSELAVQGINQNDMHFGNVLVDKSFTGGPEFNKNYLLVFNQSCILIDLPYTLFIYDFNLSTCTLDMGKAIKPVLDLPEYKSKGNCPNFHPKRDFFRLLCSMYHFIQTMKNRNVYAPEDQQVFNQIQEEIITRLFLNDSIRKKIVNEDSNCWFVNVDGISLLCNDSTLNTGLVEITDILNWCFGYTCWNENVIQVIDIEDGLLTDSEEKLLKKNISLEQLENNIQFVSITTDLKPAQFFTSLRSFFL